MLFEEGLFDRIRPAKDYILLFIDESYSSYVVSNNGIGRYWYEDLNAYLAKYNTGSMFPVVLFHPPGHEAHLCHGPVPGVQHAAGFVQPYRSSVVSILQDLNISAAYVTVDNSGSYGGTLRENEGVFKAYVDNVLREDLGVTVKGSVLQGGERWLTWAVAGAAVLGAADD